MLLLKTLFRRFRRCSPKHSKDDNTSSIFKSMRNDIDNLLRTITDPIRQQMVDKQMKLFLFLLDRYLSGTGRNQELNWDTIKSPTSEQIIEHEMLLKSVGSCGIETLAVLKINGGVGKSMGMKSAKCALEIKDGISFLDVVVEQMENLNSAHNVDIPLILMNSLYTHEDTMRITEKYDDRPTRVFSFVQSSFPNVLQESFELCPNILDDESAWYPPGHGDLYASLFYSGILDKLLAEGKEYLFVSNSDNIGAVVDERILQYMIETQTQFLMEVTKRTKADIEGGTLVDQNGKIRLLELSQVPAGHIDDLHKLQFFNTNNLWVNLQALKYLMEKGGMNLDIIAKAKSMDDGQHVIQLETAAGAAIQHFKNARAINVPRSRFMPVKNCSDLLLLTSDIYSLSHGQLVVSEERQFGTSPVIKLGEHFTKIQDFRQRFKDIPSIIELDHLTVAGDVYFGRNVTMRGTVIVVANKGQRIDIPDGCILENQLISGNLNMTEL
ncbi:UTP-glucose-1-phosphate uridylyltransferase [Infundibulicybe gibba]|nr:UTP-glucose-1-phosphate uridylyltransferase [Infundibulicybe gibba]